jgi:hypothetical protein
MHFYNQFKRCLNPYKTLNTIRNGSPYSTFSINSKEVKALCDSLFGVKLNQERCYLVYRLLYNFNPFTLIPFIHDGLVIRETWLCLCELASPSLLHHFQCVNGS